MGRIYWQCYGEGKTDIVLLHGWGLNAEVWQNIIPQFSAHYRLHVVDLPGYGRSQGFGALNLVQMAQKLAPHLPPRAIVLGWSLGGLVAIQLALSEAKTVRALIVVASSPCFTARANWPGLSLYTLQNFQQQLNSDFQHTVERFLTLQTLGTKNAHADVRQLKEVVLSQPMPTVEVLNGGLKMLRVVDLRLSITSITQPFLRIYGSLDSLVPRCIVSKLDQQLPASLSVVIEKAAHAPFISHSELFLHNLYSFINNLP